VGGIRILWNTDNVDVNIIAKKPRAIYCTMFEKITSAKCVLLTVYAPAQIHEKNDF